MTESLRVTELELEHPLARRRPGLTRPRARAGALRVPPSRRAGPGPDNSVRPKFVGRGPQAACSPAALCQSESPELAGPECGDLAGRDSETCQVGPVTVTGGGQ
jgi:hypothetical protein